MKKLLALLLAMLMLLSLVACSASKKDNTDPGDGTTVEMTPDTTTKPDETTAPPETSEQDAAAQKVAQYVEANKAELLSSFETSFATSSGMTCTSSIVAEGRGFTIKININELEDVPAETKQQLQDAYDSMNATFVSALESMRTELPELEYFAVNVCDKNGDLLAVIKAEHGDVVETPDTPEEKVAQYVEANKAGLLSSFESSFATSSGMTCTSTIAVEGRGFIISININELENIPADTKQQLQDTYDSMNSDFVSALESMQTELPELEYYEIRVCDKNGDLLAVVRAEHGDAEETPDDAEQKVAQYVEANKADILSSFESSFATSSGLTCTSSIAVEGTGFIIKININEMENVPAETKQQLQDAYDSMNATFVTLLDSLQEEVPEITYYEIHVCDKNGDVLAVIRAED